MSPRPWKELEKDENRIEKCENWIKMKEVQQKKRQVHTLDPASWTEWTEDEICSRNGSTRISGTPHLVKILGRQAPVLKDDESAKFR